MPIAPGRYLDFTARVHELQYALCFREAHALTTFPIPMRASGDLHLSEPSRRHRTTSATAAKPNTITRPRRKNPPSITLENSPPSNRNYHVQPSRAPANPSQNQKAKPGSRLPPKRTPKPVTARPSGFARQLSRPCTDRQHLGRTGIHTFFALWPTRTVTQQAFSSV